MIQDNPSLAQRRLSLGKPCLPGVHLLRRAARIQQSNEEPPCADEVTRLEVELLGRLLGEMNCGIHLCRSLRLCAERSGRGEGLSRAFEFACVDSRSHLGQCGHQLFPSGNGRSLLQNPPRGDAAWMFRHYLACKIHCIHELVACDHLFQLGLAWFHRRGSRLRQSLLQDDQVRVACKGLPGSIHRRSRVGKVTGDDRRGGEYPVDFAGGFICQLSHPLLGLLSLASAGRRERKRGQHIGRIQQAGVQRTRQIERLGVEAKPIDQQVEQSA